MFDSNGIIEEEKKEKKKKKKHVIVLRTPKEQKNNHVYFIQHNNNNNNNNNKKKISSIRFQTTSTLVGTHGTDRGRNGTKKYIYIYKKTIRINKKIRD